MKAQRLISSLLLLFTSLYYNECYSQVNKQPSVEETKSPIASIYYNDKEIEYETKVELGDLMLLTADKAVYGSKPNSIKWKVHPSTIKFYLSKDRKDLVISTGIEEQIITITQMVGLGDEPESKTIKLIVGDFTPNPDPNPNPNPNPSPDPEPKPTPNAEKLKEIYNTAFKSAVNDPATVTKVKSAINKTIDEYKNGIITNDIKKGLTDNIKNSLGATVMLKLIPWRDQTFNLTPEKKEDILQFLTDLQNSIN